MLLGFNSRFVSFVENHTKTHTIRAKRKVRPRVGEICHCYTGLRQKGARLLGRWPCAGVQDIRIFPEPEGIAYRLVIEIDGIRLSEDEAAELAYRDGFRERGLAGALLLMSVWWGKVHGLDAIDAVPFVGDLIHWNPKAKVQ